MYLRFGCRELIAGDREYKRELREGEMCPDDRKLQKDANRLNRKTSKFIENIIDS